MSAVGGPDGRHLEAGIDEAGLGPLLGPLALGWSALSLRAPSQDPWEALTPTVLREVPRSKKVEGSALVVADSKKVHARNPRGRARLERVAACFAAQRMPGRVPPTTGAALLAAPLAPLGPAPDDAAAPWYDELRGPLPLEADAGGLELLAERLHRDLDAAGIALVDAGLRLVPARELNASYARTNSKGATMLELTFSVLTHLWRSFGGEGLTVVVDRQGGRAHYGPALARAFPDASVSLVEERRGTSSYRLEGRAAGPMAGAWMDLAFTERAEDHSFPAALASCLAKFGREMSMAAFNRHWARAVPDVKPTAGYTTDGRRWLEDAGAAVAAADLPRDWLVRER